MRTILSIQSHVAHGYVGNRAAVFPLQRLGHEVIAINTVQFSNHTGYGNWTGEVFSADHVKEILMGLQTRDVLKNVDAVLTGYLGDPDVGEVILDALDSFAPQAMWLCDPVMGDVGRGFFVREGIPAFFKDRAVPRAQIMTPNQFELEHLTGRTIETLVEARAACSDLHKAGPDIILLTSLMHKETPWDEIQMLASSKDGQQYMISTPRLPLVPAPNGAGDCTAALFLANILSGAELGEAFSRTAGSIFALFQETQKAGSRELAMITAQDYFANPPPMEILKL